MLAKLSILVVAVNLCWSSAAPAHDMKLEGSEWGFVGDAGAAARFLSFAGENRIFGFSGCNRFSGEYLQSQDQLTIKPTISSTLGCAPESMKREEEFLSLLGKVHGIHAEHSLLMLLDEGGAQLTTLIRRSGE